MNKGSETQHFMARTSKTVFPDPHITPFRAPGDKFAYGLKFVTILSCFWCRDWVGRVMGGRGVAEDEGKAGCGSGRCDSPGELTSEAVFAEYKDRIYGYVLRLVRDAAEADDLVQETFLRVHRKLDTLEDPATLSTWLYRIATNLCYDRFRQPSYRRSIPLSDMAAGDDDGEVALEDRDTPSLDQVIDRADMGQCVREFIEHLSDGYRTVIFLHDLHGMTNPEIAEVLECSLATVKIRLHRARLRLKEALAKGCNFSHDERGALVCERKPPCK